MTQSVSLAETNDQRGFDVLETLPRLEPTFEQEECDLIDNPSINKQFTLRDAIVDGRIPQGEQLRKVHLARVLAMGRSTVREAIRQLVQEGPVEREPHRGACVRLASLADPLDVSRAREAIETAAVRPILKRPEPVETSPLRDALAELRKTLLRRARIPDEAVAADTRFHQELVRLCGSPRLTRAHETLAAETRMLLRHHPVYPAADSVSDHARLLEPLEHRDPRTTGSDAEHLRLSARLIGDELARQTGDSARASWEEERAMGEEEGTVA